jgi:rod shape-determining protein MreB
MLFAPAPRVVFHLQGDPAGGFTQVEIRAFAKWHWARALRVTFWQGQDLTDEQLLSRHYPPTGRVLDEAGGGRPARADPGVPARGPA